MKLNITIKNSLVDVIDHGSNLYQFSASLSSKFNNVLEDVRNVNQVCLQNSGVVTDYRLHTRINEQRGYMSPTILGRFKCCLLHGFGFARSNTWVQDLNYFRTQSPSIKLEFNK